MSAMKAGMDPKTARKYVRSGVVALAPRGPRTWRTRTDLLGAAWAPGFNFFEGGSDWG